MHAAASAHDRRQLAGSGSRLFRGARLSGFGVGTSARPSDRAARNRGVERLYMNCLSENRRERVARNTKRNCFSIMARGGQLTPSMPTPLSLWTEAIDNSNGLSWRYWSFRSAGAARRRLSAFPGADANGRFTTIAASLRAAAMLRLGKLLIRTELKRRAAARTRDDSQTAIAARHGRPRSRRRRPDGSR